MSTPAFGAIWDTLKIERSIVAVIPDPRAARSLRVRFSPSENVARHCLARCREAAAPRAKRAARLLPPHSDIFLNVKMGRNVRLTGLRGSSLRFPPSTFSSVLTTKPGVPRQRQATRTVNGYYPSSTISRLFGGPLYLMLQHIISKTKRRIKI